MFIYLYYVHRRNGLWLVTLRLLNVCACVYQNIETRQRETTKSRRRNITSPHSLEIYLNRFASQRILPWYSQGIRSFITEFLVETLSWKVSAFSSNEELKRSASQSTSDETTSSTHTFTDCGLTFQSGCKLSCAETPAYSVPDGSERVRPARVRLTTLSEVRTSTSFSGIDPDVPLIGSVNQDGSPGKQHYGTQYALWYSGTEQDTYRLLVQGQRRNIWVSECVCVCSV